MTELKEKYPYIRRIAYLCKHETACLVGASAKMKQQIKQLTGREVYVPEYEDIKKSDRVNSAGRAAYVERNYLMIDDSDVTIIRCNKVKQTSGTGIVYKYAKKRSKTQIILIEPLD